MTRLRVPRKVLGALLHEARAGAPHEVCGILAGRTEATGDREVVAAFPVRNVSPAPESEYLLDPEEQLRVTLRIEDELGLDLIGFYHSHPAGPAHLSATDLARASWPGASYLLVHLAPTEGFVSARWDEHSRLFLPESVLVLEPGYQETRRPDVG